MMMLFAKTPAKTPFTFGLIQTYMQILSIFNEFLSSIEIKRWRSANVATLQHLLSGVIFRVLSMDYIGHPSNVLPTGHAGKWNKKVSSRLTRPLRSNLGRDHSATSIRQSHKIESFVKQNFGLCISSEVL